MSEATNRFLAALEGTTDMTEEQKAALRARAAETRAQMREQHPRIQAAAPCKVRLAGEQEPEQSL